MCPNNIYIREKSHSLTSLSLCHVSTCSSKITQWFSVGLLWQDRSYFWKQCVVKRTGFCIAVSSVLFEKPPILILMYCAISKLSVYLCLSALSYQNTDPDHFSLTPSFIFFYVILVISDESESAKLRFGVVSGNVQSYFPTSWQALLLLTAVVTDSAPGSQIEWLAKSGTVNYQCKTAEIMSAGNDALFLKEMKLSTANTAE